MRLLRPLELAEIVRVQAGQCAQTIELAAAVHQIRVSVVVGQRRVSCRQTVETLQVRGELRRGATVHSTLTVGSTFQGVEENPGAEEHQQKLCEQGQQGEQIDEHR